MEVADYFRGVFGCGFPLYNCGDLCGSVSCSIFGKCEVIWVYKCTNDVQRVTYDVDETHALDVHTIEALGGKMMRHSGTAIMADKNDGNLWQGLAARAFDLCKQSC